MFKRFQRAKLTHIQLGVIGNGHIDLLISAYYKKNEINRNEGRNLGSDLKTGIFLIPSPHKFRNFTIDAAVYKKKLSN